MSLDQEKIKQIIQDAMVQFTTAYTLGYTKAVVKKIQDETEGVPEPPIWLLLKPGSPLYLKQGYLVKQGNLVKSWKKRWFAVDNNYRVAYWPAEKDTKEKDPKTGKPKKKPNGDFSCYGYKVKKDDDKDAKEHSLKIKPYWHDDYVKRTWRFQCANAEEYGAWKKMFQECCEKAGNPMHSNPQRRYAFEYAYTKLENYWYFRPTGSESEMLAYVVMRRLERETLDATFTAIPENAMKSKIISKLRTTVGALMAPPIDVAWKGVQVAIDKAEAPLEEKLRQVVGPLFDAIKAIKDKVQEQFQEKVVPLIAKAVAPIAEKLLPVVSQPLTKAQKDLIEEFVKHASDENRGSWHLYWDLRKRENEYDTSLEVARTVAQEDDLSNLPSMIMDSCFELLEAARYNYINVDKQTSITCAKLYHDCLLEQHRILTWLAELLALKPFNEAVGAVIDELCGPLEELIPEVVKEFISPSDILKQMASRAMQSAIQASLTSGGQAEVQDKLKEYFQQNGVDVGAHEGELKSYEETARKAAKEAKVVVAASPKAEPASPKSPQSAASSPSATSSPKAETKEGGGMKSSPSSLGMKSSPSSAGGMNPSQSMAVFNNAVAAPSTPSTYLSIACTELPKGNFSVSVGCDTTRERVHCQYTGKDGVAIRVKPVFPGERLDQQINCKEMFCSFQTVTISHTHTDGKTYPITFYQLIDGRGWVHDFSTIVPGTPMVSPVAPEVVEAFRFQGKCGCGQAAGHHPAGVELSRTEVIRGNPEPVFETMLEIPQSAESKELVFSVLENGALGGFGVATKATSTGVWKTLLPDLMNAPNYVTSARLFKESGEPALGVIVVRYRTPAQVAPIANDPANCPICREEFNAIVKRKYHCRRCGTAMCSNCTSDVKVPILGQVKLQIVCVNCGKGEQALLGPNPVPVNQTQWSGSTGLQGRSAYRMMGKDGVAVRVKPAYPGERTKTIIGFKELFYAISVVPVNHTHTDGRQYQILFYQLADGKGWVHDFSTDHPGNPSVVPEGAGGAVGAPATTVVVPQPNQPQPYQQPFPGQPPYTPYTQYPGYAPPPPGYVYVPQPYQQPPPGYVPQQAPAYSQPPEGAATPVANPQFQPVFPAGGGPQAYQPVYAPPPGQAMVAQPYVQQPGYAQPGAVAPPATYSPAEVPATFQCEIKEGIAIRKAPAYPGEKTGHVLTHNEQFVVIATTVVNHTHNGQNFPITFYQLQDGRGWAHNFSATEPGKATVGPVAAGPT